MNKLRYLLLLAPLCYVQCKKLNTLPEYKSPAGTKADSVSFQALAIEHDAQYTYILDHNYHLFFRISEQDGKMEQLPAFSELKTFAADDQYLYIERPNVYPVPYYALYRVNKLNLSDSLLLSAVAPYVTLSYYQGSLYGWSINEGLKKINTSDGTAVTVLSRDNFYISQVSFTHYNNSSRFYSGHWFFINESGKYLAKINLDGSQQTDTFHAIKTPIFDVINDRIYFSYAQPYASISGALRYSSCLASMPVNGGAMVIEDSVNIMNCNTVRLHGSLLLIGDGRFIKTFDPLTKQVATIGAMSAVADQYGRSAPAYPFVNAHTGSIYYSGYQAIRPLFKLK